MSMTTSRQIILNHDELNSNSFPDNKICTTKYTKWTFLPLFFWDQFSKPANLYFLVIAVLQQIPGLSPTGRWGTLLPLVLSLIVSMGKELFEDRARSKNDESRKEKVLLEKTRTPCVPVTLESLRVGQIVRVLRGELVPADLVLLKSSESDGICFLETAAIDGESNLKLRQALTQIPPLMDNLTDSVIICDHPNSEIYNFQGIIQLKTTGIFDDGDDQEGKRTTLALDRNQFLPRGSFLVNTEWIVGAVVYTGIETKIMQNVNYSSRRKITKMDKMNDKQNAQIVVILVVLVVALFLGHIYYTYYILHDHKYLMTAVHQPGILELIWKYFANFITFLLLLNNLVPISLSVTLEIVHACLAHLLNNDLDMYDEDLQLPSKTNSSNVLDELGRIQYIMTDKTGTLTSNQMVLKDLFVNDQIYRNCLHSKRSPPLEFLEMVALCHTVMIDTRDGSFQASSPDELALVKAAKRLGTTFTSRSCNKIEIVQMDKSVCFTIMATIEFTSDRKRMSIVLQNDQTMKYFIISKGADSAVIPLCINSTARAEEALQQFSVDGLRTLCYAQRELSFDEFEAWHATWKSAISTIGPHRQAVIDSSASTVESKLNLVGVSGIEDRLQDGVPETISTLLRANIKIWILTGDRAETAINTAYLCGLLKPHHTVLRIETVSELDDAIRNENSEIALTISGDLIANILSDPLLRKSFVPLASKSRAIVGYRLSPLQKSEITAFVQVHMKKTTLSVGDGGNDVGMIQIADVGVGINGLEGSQAARSADFSIPKFRFLSKLLLIHGAWSFHRISRVILYMMYKNFLLVLCQFWYAWFNSFSAQSVCSGMLLMFFNSLFSVAPPVIIGLTDQYVTAPELLKNPQLYQFGQKGKFYNQKTFWECIINATIQSFTLCASFFFLIHIDPIISPSGHSTNLQLSGDILFFIVLLTVSIKVPLFTNFFTRIMSVALWTSLLVCFLVLWTRSDFSVLLSSTFISASVLVPIVTLLRDFLYKFYRRQFKPRAYHIVQEMRAVEIKRSRKLKQSMSKSSSTSETTPLNK